MSYAATARTKTTIPDPPWTPTQKGEDYMLKVDGNDPAPIPGQRVIGRVQDDGSDGKAGSRRRVVEVSTTHLPYEVWITDVGNIVRLPMKTTRCLNKKGKFSDDSQHAGQQAALHYAAGWLRYDTGGYGEDLDHWLARRDGEIAARRAGQVEEMSEAEQRWHDLVEKDPEKAKEQIGDVAGSIAEGAKDRERRARAKAKLEGQEP